MQDLLFDCQDNQLLQTYKGLALKYRPNNFKELIGQEVLVKTLSNAIKANRIPQAIVLTGIRGVGKTTTARIIAKIVNCSNLNISGDLPEPCGQCASCMSIAKSQNQDVLEMDAASHTGVGDIRAIIDNIHYKPMIGNYKVYIIDEVHMLSNNAFNALLKTLEEPPQHLIFIFATTEIHKIPLTILSRCQRFDLRRLPHALLKNHYISILQKEGIESEDRAIEMITKAADGSVRDGLSMMDQAMSLSDGIIKEELVREMLCFTSHAHIVNIFIHLLNGSINAVLDLVNSLYNAGADPLMLVSQLLELIHDVSKSHITGQSNIIYGFTAEQEKQLTSLEPQFLSRCWQVMFKGLEEVKIAPNQMYALEMLLIRFCQINYSITPEELLEKLTNQNNIHHSDVQNTKNYDLNSILTLLYDANELDLYYVLHNQVAIVELKNKCIKINMLSYKSNGFATLLKGKLKQVTGVDWEVQIVTDHGVSISEQSKISDNVKKEEIESNEIVKEALKTFTGSKIVDIKLM